MVIGLVSRIHLSWTRLLCAEATLFMKEEKEMAIFKGAGVAIATPFHQDGTVNYEKFGEHCLADATVLILRFILQNRYETDRAQRLGISKFASENGVMLMIDRATSPTFFLAVES